MRTIFSTLKKWTFIGFIALSWPVLAQVEKVEPANWWAGMQHSKVQLLCYGKNISDMKVTATHNVPILDVKQTENPNYLFVTIDTKGLKPQKFELQFKGKKSQTIAYEIKERKNDSANRTSFSSSDVIYLIMPDRFANGNPKNDNQKTTLESSNRQNPDGRHGGDIAGITANLDYLKELGVTTIWNTPILTDNEPQTTYHGYAASDLYQIDPRYGSLEEYQNLSAELHKRDMKLIIDYVTNHWGISNWIVKDLPENDWIHQFPSFTRSTYRLNAQMDSNASKIDQSQTMDGWFDNSMPDMNQRNPLLLQYITQNAIWWVETVDLDGIRVDTYPYNDKDAITTWTQSVLAEYPNLNIVGEVWMHNQIQTSYWQKDSKIAAINNFNSHLPSVMDFPLHDAVSVAFKENQDWDHGLYRIYDNLSNDFVYPDINNLMIFLENHDTNRFNEIYPDFRDYQLGFTLLTTLRGIPQLYYGSEIGMKGDKGKGDGDIRKDFPGGWIGDAHNAFTEKGRTVEEKKYFDFSKKLLNWRKGKSVIHTGKTIHFAPNNNLYVYARSNESETVLVILNNQKEAQTVDVKHFEEVIKKHQYGIDVISGEKIGINKDFEIPAKTAYILELK